MSALDLSLFRSASFTWGVILASVPILAMFGVLFTMPQYFQGMVGTTAMGSDLGLLPLIGGLLAGAVPAARIARFGGRRGRRRGRLRAARRSVSASVIARRETPITSARLPGATALPLPRVVR